MNPSQNYPNSWIVTNMDTADSDGANCMEAIIMAAITSHVINEFFS